MITEELLIKIKSQDFYTARTLTQAGLIKNNRVNANSYNFILKEIKRGKLKVVNMNAEGLKPAYRIYPDSIINYLNNLG